MLPLESIFALLLLLITGANAWKKSVKYDNAVWNAGSWWDGAYEGYNSQGFPWGHRRNNCPTPNIPDGISIDNQGPYSNGATINARCRGNGYILGPSSMTCVFGNWAPSFFGQCSNGPQYSCPTPRTPDGADLSSQGPFASGDTVQVICHDGGYVIGVSSMSCVMGHWAPSTFGDCTNSKRYSCQIPQPSPGMALSRQGVVKSDESVTASCTEDMKVLVGIKSITCVLGQWAPSSFGQCTNINELGTVVYSDNNGRVIIKYRYGNEIKDLGNGQLLIKFFSGGYGIEQVKGYNGTPDSEGYNWSISNGRIYRNGEEIPNQSASFGTIRLSGYKILPQNSGMNTIYGIRGVTEQNGILYVNGVPLAQRTVYGSGSISVNIMGSNSFMGNTFVNSVSSTGN